MVPMGTRRDAGGIKDVTEVIIRKGSGTRRCQVPWGAARETQDEKRRLQALLEVIGCVGDTPDAT